MITILSGGTGTPKLIQGIKEIYPEEEINVIVNTVENLYMSGGYIAADIDTVMYTFADMIDDEFWYGIKGDTFIVREQLIEMGTTELLKLGDRDRATKLQKAILLDEGWTLSEIVELQKEKLGVKATIIPMSDEESEITIVTKEYGEIEFHDFLIKYQCKCEVLEVKYGNVKPSPKLIEAINESDKVIIGPSNPITSIRPIVSLDGVVEALKEKEVIAVSPFVGKSAFSGPAGQFMNAFGYESSSIGVAEIYKPFLSKFVIDNQDAEFKEEIEEIIPNVIVTNTFMKTIEDKINLAKVVLE
ncbi:2-phospho-L-lactate transferase [Methanobrevibacter sp.]|uniref:2-phospho-L-lactate transferase n=1 Tax=Methanobrevibacter sp. TaxID=66852 RepID=UPI0025F819AE|nr:2-phospho-L-lactate transferase [Methanobrevibacter sp.]MBQ2961670.1 2-phospho-L-lactate transferase [Methanobrevibacter sp.]